MSLNEGNCEMTWSPRKLEGLQFCATCVYRPSYDSSQTTFHLTTVFGASDRALAPA